MISKNLTAASTKPIILGILKQGKSYGYLIITKIKEISGGKLEWSDGMLYPVLHRLEKDEFIRSEWILSEGSRPRKYYEITEKGKKELLIEKEQWVRVNSIVNEVLEIKPAI